MVECRKGKTMPYSDEERARILSEARAHRAPRPHVDELERREREREAQAKREQIDREAEANYNWLQDRNYQERAQHDERAADGTESEPALVEPFDALVR
jgi:hypothetical protein